MPHKCGEHNDKYGKVTKRQMRKVPFKLINRLEVLFYVMSTRNVLAICLQETWCYRNEILENGHYRLITSGLSQNMLNNNCGSQGVAML